MARPGCSLCATSMMRRSVSMANSSALMLLGRPTNNGMTIWENNHIAQRQQWQLDGVAERGYVRTWRSPRNYRGIWSAGRFSTPRAQTADARVWAGRERCNAPPCPSGFLTASRYTSSGGLFSSMVDSSTTTLLTLLAFGNQTWCQSAPAPRSNADHGRRSCASNGFAGDGQQGAAGRISSSAPSISSSFWYC